jgi:hypothetical protein
MVKIRPLSQATRAAKAKARAYAGESLSLHFFSLLMVMLLFFLAFVHHPEL